MLRNLLCAAAVLALAVSPALADTASKDGTPVYYKAGIPTVPSGVRSDFEYNTGGSIDFVPDSGGSSDGWGEWFITTVLNNTGNCLRLMEFGFPCCGPPTEAYGWIVWVDVGGINPPPGNAYTAEYYGPFTPVDPNPDTFPPITYTYIDVSGEAIIVPPGAYLCFGYDNTGTGGQTSFNGVQTWAWYGGYWDPDIDWGRTAILQVKADFWVPSAATSATWGSIKDLYR